MYEIFCLDNNVSNMVGFVENLIQGPIADLNPTPFVSWRNVPDHLERYYIYYVCMLYLLVSTSYRNQQVCPTVSVNFIPTVIVVHRFIDMCVYYVPVV